MCASGIFMGYRSQENRHYKNAYGFDQTREWQLGKPERYGQNPEKLQALSHAIRHAVRYKDWQWPDRPIIFLSDPHADAEAFISSLESSGSIRRTGKKLHDYRLTGAGSKASIIIGGDCLDKGPSNLELLRSIRKLASRGAHVRILAGNHDVRLLTGLNALNGQKKAGDEHFFLRMTPKAIPLLSEVHDEYLKGRGDLKRVPSARECKRRLYPSDKWFEEFPGYSSGILSQSAIDKELRRMEKKAEHFEKSCDDAGLCLRRIYASADKCRELFLGKAGEFAWFFRHMELAHREGSFLFVHAGLDDHVAGLIRDRGIRHLNREFRRRSRSDLSDFYYGPLANTMRTKYRESDRPLTDAGVDLMHQQGIHAIVHGHRNRLSGQRLKLRQGMLHIECDITLDRHSREKEGLEGIGAGVTIIHPKGKVIGISNDYPHAKVFEPQRHLP